MKKKKESIADHIIALVDEMRENTKEFRMWKNIPLAEECVRLLRQLDDPEETTGGKAWACHAICEQLPEYDVPRFVIGILRYEHELAAAALAAGEEGIPDIEEIDQDIQRLTDYINTEHISTETFRERYDRHLDFDPIERTPQWEESYYGVEEECDRRLGDIPRGMGFCFAYWSTRKDILAERGIEWKTPQRMNPGVMFD